MEDTTTKNQEDRYVIDSDSYGDRTEFESLADAESGIRACGEGFEGVSFREVRGRHGEREIHDQNNVIVGYIIDARAAGES